MTTQEAIEKAVIFAALVLLGGFFGVALEHAVRDHGSACKGHE